MEFDEKALDEVRESRLLIDRFDDWIFEELSGYVGQRVVEVGCGLGNHFKHFLDRETLIGFDISAESVQLVRKKFSAFPNVRILKQQVPPRNQLRLLNRLVPMLRAIERQSLKLLAAPFSQDPDWPLLVSYRCPL